MSPARTYCDVDECLEEAKSAGKCWAHAKQAARGVPLRPVRKRLAPRAEVLEAIIAVVDADAADDRAFERAWKRFKLHARRYLYPQCARCSSAPDCPRTGRG